MGCTDSHCGGAGIGEVNKPAQTFNFPNSYSLANNLREAQITITPPQSDLPRRYLHQKSVLTNPSYGVPVTSVVRAGGSYEWTRSGDVCATAGGQGYYTV